MDAVIGMIPLVGQGTAVRDLLEEHLELKRYQHLPGLRRQELTRLVGVADAAMITVQDFFG